MPKSKAFHSVQPPVFAAWIALILLGTHATAQEVRKEPQPATTASVSKRQDALLEGFRIPPQSAHPRVWWHWMNGNISKEGIRLDLEWMHRIGIAGFQNFDAAIKTPQVVPQRLAYMSPEWKDAFRYAIRVGDRFGMDMGIAGSPGWSESGGPWVPPSQAMKKYVWSETTIPGGQHFLGRLPEPPHETGPIQNIAKPIEEARPDGGNGIAIETPEFYADAAVVAFRDTEEDTNQAIVTSSDPNLDARMLSDGDLQRIAHLPAPHNSAWILFSYPKPETIRAITYVTCDPSKQRGHFVRMSAPLQVLEASDDGTTFREVSRLTSGASIVNTISIPTTTARYFRIRFEGEPYVLDRSPSSTEPSPGYAIAELVLHPDSRVHRLEEKAAFAPVVDLYKLATPTAGASTPIASTDVINLRSFMKPDGTLDWTPPTGRWRILRIGYSLLGITNHPATPEATGLEVDKLNRTFVKNYFETYLDSYKNTVGPTEMGKRGIQNVVNDSWEAGSQNWTEKMLQDFQRLRGYDPTPWLPVLTGRIVENTSASDRFLWDFRKTIADLTATEHYGQLQQTLAARGITHYGESHESTRAFVADGMEVKKMDDVPMGAMWTPSLKSHTVSPGYNADDRESASVAHIYGQNLAAAESMTAAIAPWAWSPSTLKSTADQEFLNGINRIIIHESTHQPTVGRVPGLTLGPYGQWFNRNETWAEEAKPWIDYLSRCSFMLQQGRFAADIVYFYGEDSNITAIFSGKGPQIPPGFNFDYINADGLIHELHTDKNELTTKSGMRYKVLALDPYSQHMSLPVLESLYRLVQNGATVVGPKPFDDPSLADDRNRFNQLANALFGDGTGLHKVGAGSVLAGGTLEAALRLTNTIPDFAIANNNAEVDFVHRILQHADIYFLDNRSDQDISIKPSFRVIGKQPELWRAEDGSTAPVSFEQHSGQTSVSLHLHPWETAFVVFRKTTPAPAIQLPEIKEVPLQTLDGPWTLAFQKDRGAPSSIEIPALIDLSTQTNPGIKYFSGEATYSRTIDAPADWFSKSVKLYLDLGDVKNLAVVTLNGKRVGQVWHAPFRLDVSSALKRGKNTLEVKVINAWVNRLIGDEQPGASPITYADFKPYKADAPLQPSGLLGPVTLVKSEPR